MPSNPDGLYEEALIMATNKNLVDVETLLAWARESENLRERIRNIEQALGLLADVRDQLKTLDLARRGL
ncbi:MAG TPA: hypothetical protein VM889_02800 [Candidatus Thermoplasmatota archaeon]|nr:hypothetical protein [Candidatus Thermoplasmatota archaeon]